MGRGPSELDPTRSSSGDSRDWASNLALRDSTRKAEQRKWGEDRVGGGTAGQGLEHAEPRRTGAFSSNGVIGSTRRGALASADSDEISRT
jgi:hypothetical protein